MSESIDRRTVLKGAGVGLGMSRDEQLAELAQILRRLSEEGVRRILAIARALLAEEEIGRKATRESILREAAILGVTMPEDLLRGYPSEAAA